MQHRLPDGLGVPEGTQPHRLLSADGPPSLAEVLIRRNAQAREAKRDALLAEVYRSVAELVLASGTDRSAGRRLCD
jgi:hypothetical protein